MTEESKMSKIHELLVKLEKLVDETETDLQQCRQILQEASEKP